ncbi:hypothetical protein NUU61_001238 [Penicillium alfredii]|uniref:NAD-dependent epimerase/dehydratase domain-containing protein n=1 Tax=Penicillium alfredii TaxID=1506179 RepID=A0A9W9GB47_9EURO|nr:uncharacterized protein NUU61_001238 [Penicillium alfredii]KAJ5115479.1 hypothetical protein NUU61_001238 [Penicillium alfredii]
MSRGLIFITGATGFVGSATAIEALKAGYRLRICVRKASDTLQILLAEYGDQLEFVTVPDFTAEGAFDGQLDGVDYVLHIASPFPQGMNKTFYFPPAVQGTLAVLKEAAKVLSVKKVVVTSSLAALIPVKGIPEGGVIREDNDWDFSVDEEADFTDPNNPDRGPMKLYHASKLLANAATWDFWQTSKPHYSLVVIHPASVHGYNPVQTSAEGIKTSTNNFLWKPIMEGAPATLLIAVHIQDVAEAHVKALDPKIADGSKYLLGGKVASWKDVAHIVGKEYPQAGAKITQDVQNISIPFNTSKAETELGMQWRPLEEMVREVMDQQLEFLG